MRFRVATLNLEQDHKRWDARRALVIEQLGAVRPDVLALNEICVPKRTAHWIRDAAKERFGLEYCLVQQTRVNGLSAVEGEALLTRFPVVETGNLDYRTRDIVALVARLLVGGNPLDVYVTHQVGSVFNDSLRLYQAQQLLAWVDDRADIPARVVCGDFNATPDMPSAALMAMRFKPTQNEPTAFTALAGVNGEVSHPDWPRMDRCIDYIWVSDALRVAGSRVCFNRPSAADPTLWPSDHAGVSADLELRDS
jgi:endonuclease/exonuclease/phosphatase family metal-dependent hydrolase